MNNSTQQNYSYPSTVAADLEAALSTLEKVTTEEKAPSSIRKVIDLICSILPTRKKSVQKENDQQKVDEAIEVIYNLAPYVDSLRNGNEEQQRLAQRFSDIIERYNKNIERKRREKNSTFLFNSHVKNKKLHAPAIRLQPHFSAKAVVNKTEQYIHKAASAILAPSKKEKQELTDTDVEMLWMKAIVLGQPYGVNRAAVKDAPIEVFDSDCSLTFNPLPGELFTLTGKLAPVKGARNRHPVPDSFHLSFRAIQTGYPHALQSNAWGLGNDLIPKCPHRPEEMPATFALIEKKNALALALLPKGCKNKTAKEILQAKRTLFNENKAEFVPLHKSTIYALLHAAPPALLSKHAFEILDKFYAFAAEQENPYDTIADAFETISEFTITKPYETLQETRLKDETFLVRIQEEGYEAVLDMLKKATTSHLASLANNPSAPFIKMMATLFSTPTHFIISQEMSEILLFDPPILNEFMRKIQAAAFMLLNDFMAEIESTENLSSEMRAQLIRARFLMEEEALPTSLETVVNELEEYYYRRYNSRTKGTARSLPKEPVGSSLKL